MIKTILLFIFAFAAFNATAQTDTTLKESDQAYRSSGSYHYQHRMDTLYFRESALKLAYAYNGGRSFSLGYNVARLNYLVDFPAATNRVGPTVSLGGLYKDDDLYLSGSLSFSGHYYLIYGNISADYFTNFKNNSMYISPEIGITFAGHLHFGYSRQFALINGNDLKLKNQFIAGMFLTLPHTRRMYYVLGRRAEYLDWKR